MLFTNRRSHPLRTQSHHRPGAYLSRLGISERNSAEPKSCRAESNGRACSWHLLKFKETFGWNVFAKEEEKMKRKKLARLQTLAASLNYQLVPNQ